VSDGFELVARGGFVISSAASDISHRGAGRNAFLLRFFLSTRLICIRDQRRFELMKAATVIATKQYEHRSKNH
jgi:hypothetical protein